MGEAAEEFVRCLQVWRVHQDRFRVIPPTLFGSDRVFGGVVVAHALNAALQTVDDPTMRPHSLHGCFLGPVRPDVEVDLDVERWRDGRSFTTRHTTMRQAGRPVMAATVSFHIDEPGDAYQLPMDTTVAVPEHLPANEWDRPFESREAGPVTADDGSYRSTRRVWLRFPFRLPDAPAIHATMAAYVSDMTGSSFRW